MQGPLYDAVCDRIGHELFLGRSYVLGTVAPVEHMYVDVGNARDNFLLRHVPYHICLITFLPMMLLAAVNVFGCDDGPCDKSAKQSDSTLLRLVIR